jgi:hypothetical protein
MQKMRKLSVVLMVLLLLVMGSVVAAQDIPCGDLSEEDCTLLSGIGDSMATVDSATFTIDATITSTADDEESTITISGDGSFSGVAGMMSSSSIEGMMSDPAAAADPTAMIAAATAMLGNFNGALNLNVDPGTGSPLDIQLVLVDSIGYVNFGALGLAGMQLGEDMTLPEWGGVNLPELIGTFGSSMAGSMPGMGGATTGGDTGTSTLPEDFDPETFASYITITRGEDDAMDDGTAVATFEIGVDFAGMMSDPSMQEALAEMDEDELAAAQAMYENMEFSLNVYVGLEDNYLYGVDLGLSMDASALSNLGDPSEAVGTVDVAFSLYFADYNNAPVVDAPEGAEVATTQQLMSLMGMMMGGPASR